MGVFSLINRKHVHVYNIIQKSLKISNGLSEDVNRRSDNTMSRRKKTNGQTIQCPEEKRQIDGQTIQCPEEKRQKDKQWSKKKTLHRKLNIEQHEPR